VGAISRLIKTFCESLPAWCHTGFLTRLAFPLAGRSPCQRTKFANRVDLLACSTPLNGAEHGCRVGGRS